jgi:5'-nucleotidase
VFQRDFKADPAAAVTTYREYCLLRENEPLSPGTGMPLVRALLELNKYKEEGAGPLVVVVVMSQNSPETGLRVLHNIRRLDLGVSRSAFTGGESVTSYLDAFDVDLFLTTRPQDATQVADAGTCAVALVKAPPSDMEQIPEGQVRIAFDADAVLFDDTSELINKSEGLASFRSHEDAQQDSPIKAGPHAQFLRKLSRLQARLPFNVEFSPVHIAIVTARDAPAEMRVIKTLRHWNIYVNQIFFLGGVEKARVLKAFRPHIFFDDQDIPFHTIPKDSRFVKW